MKNREDVLLIVSGFLSLAVVIGIGRFVYTPILPYMEAHTKLNLSALGMLATWNYVGYFLGAMIARFITAKKEWIITGLFLNSITTFLIGIIDQYYLWLLFRLFSGVSSGLVFVLVSHLILERLNVLRKNQYSGFLYSGVGFGILLTGLLVPFFMNSLNWFDVWKIFGAISLLMTILISVYMKSPTRNNKLLLTSAEVKQRVYKSKKKRFALYVSYAIEGFAYIIYATYITGLLTNQSDFTFNAAYVWAVVGIGAIPSCIFWSWLGKHISASKALMYAYSLQIISVFIPVFSNHIVIVCISAFFFGATFLGIITLVMNISKQFQDSLNLISGLTVVYALGQIIGPLLGGLLIDSTGFHLPFLFSGFTILVSLCFIYFAFRKKTLN